MKLRSIIVLLALLPAACGPGSTGGGNSPQGHGPAAQSSTDMVSLADAEITGSASEATFQELSLFFEQLGQAGHAGNADKALAMMDFPLMLAATEATGLVKINSPAERAVALKGMPQGARSGWFKPGNGVLDWNWSKVTRAGVSENGRFAVAFVSHAGEDGLSRRRFRWWLVKQADGWKVYDFESLDNGLRTSWLIATVAANPDRLPAWQSATNYLLVACTKLKQEDYDGASEYLLLARDASLPREFDAWRSALLGFCEAGLENYESALEHFERALALNDDMPMARYGRGRSLFALGDYNAAIKDLRWYTVIIGSDPIALIDLGDCYSWLDRYDDARKAYTQSLEDTPSWGAVAGLALCLKEEELPLLGEWFLKLKNRAADYLSLMENLYYERDMNAAAQAITEAYAPVAGDDAHPVYFSGRFLYDEGKAAEAAAAFKAALNGLPAEELNDCREWYWYAMYDIGKSLEALAEAKDATLATGAFEAMARRHLKDGDAEGLHALCEARAKTIEPDAGLLFYQAEVAYLRDDWAGAEKLFRAGLVLKPSEDSFGTGLRHGLIDVMQQQDRALEAYLEFAEVADTFSYLQGLLSDAGKAEPLAAIIEAHGKTKPGDLSLVRARGNLAWLKQEWKTAAAEYQRYLAKPAEEDYDLWECAERGVRAALRSRQYDLARGIAKTAFDEPNQWLTILAQAGSGRSIEAIKAVHGYLEGLEPETAQEWMNELYNDEDVGETLRGGPYKQLHATYPPPAKPEKPATPEGE